MRRIIGLLILFGTSACVDAQNIRVHDPVLIRQGDTYYLFCTGMGISSFSSTDMKNWKAEKPVFDAPPAWAVQTVPGFKGHIWAPDISFSNGLYYLYYSVSAFGNGDLKQVAQPEEWLALAKRERSFKTDDKDPGEGAIEAPFIFKMNGF